MNLKDFARVSVSKSQQKGSKTNVSVKTLSFYGALALGSIGVLSSLVAGCAPAANTANVAKDSEVSETPKVSVIANSVSKDSKTWENLDQYNEQEYRNYITKLITSYDKNASAIEVQEVVNFAVQLNLFTTHVNADLQSKSNYEIDKGLLILSNKAESIMQKGNSAVKKTIRDKHITDNLMSLSEQMKVCKVLTASPIELFEGSTATVSVKAQPANAKLKLVYSVKDTKVATVSNKGVVKGIAKGSTVLTVTDKNTEVSTQVNINIKAKTVKVDSKKKTNNTEKKTNNNTEKKTNNNTEKKTNNNTEKKTNDASTKKSVDTSNKSESKPASKSNTKTQTKPTVTKTKTKQAPKITATSVTLDINNLNLTAGGSRELNAYVHYSDGSSNYSGITWSSSNTGVATVDGYGNVYAHSAGTARITASYGSFKASCSVTVKAAQQSKPQTQTPTTSNNNNSGGNSGGSSSNKGGSGNKGGSTTKKQTNTNNSGGNSGGSTTTKKQTNKGGNGGGNTKTKKQQTASKWKASDHAKDKVYSTGGYEMYECPEIVKYINKYRRQAGVPEVEWRGGTAYCNKIKKWFYNLSKEEQKQTRNECPEWFNSKGEFDVKKCVEGGQMCTRDSLEYCIKTQSLNHGNEYNPSATSNINIGAGYDNYNPEEWIRDMQSSPAHWEILLDKNATTIYAVYNNNVCCVLI